MPQLDPSTYVSQLFWLFLSITVLWAILTFGVLPPLKRLFESRQRMLDEMFKETQDLRRQAEFIVLDAQEKLRLARISCEEAVKLCTQENNERIRQAKEAHSLEAQSYLSDASQRMEALKQDTLEDLSAKIPEIATALMAQLTRRYLPKEEVHH